MQLDVQKKNLFEDLEIFVIWHNNYYHLLLCHSLVRFVLYSAVVFHFDNFHAIEIVSQSLLKELKIDLTNFETGYEQTKNYQRSCLWLHYYQPSFDI